MHLGSCERGCSVVEWEAFVDRADELSGGVDVGMWCRSGVLFYKSGCNFAAVRIGLIQEGDGLVGVLRSAFSS